jgi:PKD repeat protein
MGRIGHLAVLLAAVMAVLTARQARADSAIVADVLDSGDTSQTVRLSLDPPELSSLSASDGRTYTRISLKGCGLDNEAGLPALPVVSWTLEIPAGVNPTVSVTAEQFGERQLAQWVYPQQPPAPKNGVARDALPFVIDLDYYTGAKVSAKRAIPGVTEYDTTQYTAGDKTYLNIVARPYEYDPLSGQLRYPTSLLVDAAWTLPQLPAAAGPRLGRVLIVETTISDPAQIAELTEAGFSVDGRRGNTITLYATPDEVAQLESRGFVVTVVDEQPRKLPGGSSAKGAGAYHNYAGVTGELEALAAAYPQLCKLSTYGKSAQNRDLWALKISDNPLVSETEPEVKIGGGIHGDEIVGPEMCIYFAHYLLENYATDTRVKAAVDSAEIWLVPLINPDGRELGTRENAGGFDLNRTFPEGSATRLGNTLFGPEPTLTQYTPPEVARMMEWVRARNFALSLQFHGGAACVNYPYDNDDLGSTNSPTPDDAIVREIAVSYAATNPTIYANNGGSFDHGVINGAVWYVVSGGMQDWSYRYAGCIDYTIEMSVDKTPAESTLPQYWSENRESMLRFCEAVQGGIHGVVTDSISGQPIAAAIHVAGNYHPVFSAADQGDFHRLAQPGTYTVTVSAPNHAPMTIPAVIVGEGEPAWLTVSLDPVTPQRDSIAVVANSTFASVATNYAVTKTAQGFPAHVFTFTGVPTADAVRKTLRDTYRANPLKYAVILGDIEQVPTYTSNSDSSDLPYGLLDKAEYFSNYLGRDIYVGRVSVDTPAEAENYRQKMDAFFANPKHNDITWVSGGNTDSENNVAEGTHNWVMQNALDPSIHNELFYRNSRSLAELTTHITGGTDGFVYSGHGQDLGVTRYGFDVTRMSMLANTLDATVVLAHCCDTGTFNQPTCFAEAWMETTARGVIYVGASDYTYWDEDDIMERREFEAMNAAPGLSIGETVTTGLRSVHDNYFSRAQYYHTVYQIFGDPSLSMLGSPELSIITSPILPIAYTGEAWSVQLAAVNGTPPYLWDVAEGELPQGLTLSANTGSLSGVAEETAQGSASIRVTDNTGRVSVRVFQYVSVGRLAATSPAQLPQAKTGEVYDYQLEAEGGIPPYRWALTGTGSYLEETVTADWVDGGTAQNWHSDDYTWVLELPWAFPFYGKDYTKVNVCSNGYLDFTSADWDYENSISGLANRVSIAALWDDLTTAPSANNIFVTQSDTQVVVRWLAAFYGAETMPVEFAVRLYPTGAIQFDYKAIATCTPTIGISSGDGVNYTLASINGAGSIGAPASLRFDYGGVIPRGLSFGTDGRLTGTPKESGLFEFETRILDSASLVQTVRSTFSLEAVEGEGEPPEGQTEGQPVEGTLPEGQAEGQPVEGTLPEGQAEGQPVEGILPEGQAEGQPVEGTLPEGQAEGQPVEGVLPEGQAEGQPVEGTLPEGEPVGPDAYFEVSATTGTAPLSVTFTDASDPGSAAIETWLWSFGDGSTSHEPDPVHVYNWPGTYNVSLTVQTAVGYDSAVRASFIRVTAPPEGEPVEGDPIEGAVEGELVEGVLPEGAIEGQPLEGTLPEGAIEGQPPEGELTEGTLPEGDPVEGVLPEGQAEGEPVEGSLPEGQTEGEPVEGEPVEGVAPEGEVQPVYFIMSDIAVPEHGSYLLPLTDPDDIAHARSIVESPESASAGIAVAYIEFGTGDGFISNHDPYHPDKVWSWHVSEFIEFADMTVEVYDGWADFVEDDVNGWIANTGGRIGFWAYRPVAEYAGDIPEGEIPTEGDLVEGEPVDGEIPLEGEVVVEGETPVEGETVDGETPVEGQPVPNPPEAKIRVSLSSGVAPFTATFWDESWAGDKPITKRSWDMGVRGAVIADATEVTYTFMNQGVYDVKLTVTTEVSTDTVSTQILVLPRTNVSEGEQPVPEPEEGETDLVVWTGPPEGDDPDPSETPLTSGCNGDTTGESSGTETGLEGQ